MMSQSFRVLITLHVKPFDDDGVTPSASLVPLRQGDSFKYFCLHDGRTI